MKLMMLLITEIIISIILGENSGRKIAGGKISAWRKIRVATVPHDKTLMGKKFRVEKFVWGEHCSRHWSKISAAKLPAIEISCSEIPSAPCLAFYYACEDFLNVNSDY